MMKAQRTPLLEPLCHAFDFDLVVLDGGQYTGNAELNISLSACDPSFIAMDDTNVEKHSASFKQLAGNSSWHLVWRGGETQSALFIKTSMWKQFQFDGFSFHDEL